jgi:predicted DNA-binding transcriptional regulator AlpA
MSGSQNDPNQLLTERDTASLIGFTERALQNWRVRGGGPQYVKVAGRSVRYRRSDVLTWIEQRIRSNTCQQ